MLVAWSVKEDKRVVSRYILEIDVAVCVNELSWGKGEKRGMIKAGIQLWECSLYQGAEQPRARGS